MAFEFTDVLRTICGEKLCFVPKTGTACQLNEFQNQFGLSGSGCSSTFKFAVKSVVLSNSWEKKPVNQRSVGRLARVSTCCLCLQNRQLMRSNKTHSTGYVNRTLCMMNNPIRSRTEKDVLKARFMRGYGNAVYAIVAREVDDCSARMT